MKPLIFAAIFALCLFAGSSADAGRKIWVTAYYAGWMQGTANNGHLKAGEIDFSAVTHVIHFGLIPRKDGSFDTSGNGVTSANSDSLLARAHAAKRKVLIAVGGRESAANFLGATNGSHINTFVTNLVNFMARKGYDGIDIDWEVLREEDGDQFITFISRLRTVLDGIHPRPLLTAAAGNNPAIYAKLQEKFDQINLMTYDMAGAWSGWPAWHNGALFDGGATFPFPRNFKNLPSVSSMVQDFRDAGIDASRLGIGIDYYGYVWQSGVTGGKESGLFPGRKIEGTPAVQPNVPYYEIVQKYRPETSNAWDSLAQASYLRLEQGGKSIFVSYDDERSCAAKTAYARQQGLGGVMIWELGGGFLPATFGNRDRLLQAVKLAAE